MMLNDFVLRGARFGAWLPQPRAFESRLLAMIVTDLAPRGNQFGDIFAFSARR